MVTDKGELSA